LLTALDRVNERVTGLACGADDYIIKPFVLAELLARIRSLVRRAKADDAAVPIRLGRLEYHPDKRAVAGAGEVVYLSKKEAALFELLLQQRGRPVSRERLSAEIWRDKPVSGQVVDPLVSQLRKRLAPLRRLCTVSNERGTGFVLRLDG
jgi:two-component system response regulator MprA